MPVPPPLHGASMVSLFIKQSSQINEIFDCDYVNISPSRSMSELQKAGFRKLYRLGLSLIKTMRLLLTHRYDLVYLAITCHGTPFLKDFPFVALSKLFGRRILIHQHNKGMSKDVYKLPFKWLFPMAYRNTKVMLLSRHLYPDISEIVSEEQVYICPNGIPEPPLETKKCKDNKETPHILFLSNLLIEKGCYILLDACRILKDKGYRFVCNIVGAESHEIRAVEFQERITNSNLNDVVIYHGPKYREEKEEYWNKADIFAFPTFYGNEAFPLVLLEAMQHRVPIVTTKEGGIPDIVSGEKTGLFCQQRNAESLAEALATLLNSPEKREAYAQAGYERYKEHYTQSAFENNFINELKKILRPSSEGAKTHS